MPYKDRGKKNENAKKYYHQVLKISPEYKKKAYQTNQRWRNNNLEKVRKWRRDWSKQNPDKVFAQKLRSTYGISLETYQILLDIQNKVCAICGKEEPNKKYKTLGVDHNHNTGQIRGLLCTKCNTAIGLLNEDLDLINKVIIYLKKYNG